MNRGIVHVPSSGRLIVAFRVNAIWMIHFSRRLLVPSSECNLDDSFFKEVIGSFSKQGPVDGCGAIALPSSLTQLLDCHYHVHFCVRAAFLEVLPLSCSPCIKVSFS